MLELTDYLTAFDIPPDTKGADVARDSVLALCRESKFASVDSANETLAKRAAEEAARRLDWRLRTDLEALLSTHQLLAGERDEPDQGDPDGWDAGLQEQIEDYAAGTIRDGIGEDGIGEALSLVSFAGDDWIGALARHFAEGVVAALTRGKTPAQQLSAIGIVKDDVAALVDETAAPPPTPPPAETPKDKATAASKAMFTVIDLLRDFAEPVGAEDAESLAAMLGGWGTVEEWLWSSDEAKRLEALETLGAGNKTAAKALAAVVENSTPREVFAAVFSDEPAPTGEPAPRKKSRKRATPGPWNEIAERVRDLFPGTDTDKAKALGLTRATFVNYATGKTGWEPGDDEIAVLTAAIEIHAGALQQLHSDMRALVPIEEAEEVLPGDVD